MTKLAGVTISESFSVVNVGGEKSFALYERSMTNN